MSFIRFSAPKEGNYEGVVYDVKDNYFLFLSNGERLYVYEKNNSYEIGDILNIKGYKENLSFTVLESSFDFGEYLTKKGIYHELHPQEIRVTFSSFLKLHLIKKRFLNNFDESTRGLVSSILFSDGESSDVVESIRFLHLSRFLSANGTYIYAFIGFITYFLEKLYSKKWSELSAFGCTLLYLIFVFPRFTVIRICVLFLFRWLNKYIFNKHFSYFEIISITGLFFLIIDPFLARQDSFIIGYLVPMVIQLVRQVLKKKGKILKTIIPAAFLYIFFLPFELQYYNSIAPLSPLYQLILSPLFVVIGVLSIISFMKLPVYGVVGFLSKFLNNIASFFKVISIEFYAAPLNPFLTLIYYLIFIIFLYYFEAKNTSYLKAIFPVYLAFIFPYFVPINNFISTEVSFINVGQGDACLIRDKNVTIMIDTGGLTYKDLASDTLIPYFKKNKIYKIDMVITTHDDFDHVGALFPLNEKFKIRHYVNDASYFPLKVGRITLNNYNNHTFDYEDENSKSLVIGFNLSNRNYLIMGDAPIAIEKKIMEEYSYIPCDILKVGHHGSDTSSYKPFLEYVSPNEAVISCGKGNKFGHPHKSVIDNLKSLGIKIKRTDISGTIKYKSYIFNE